MPPASYVLCPIPQCGAMLKSANDLAYTTTGQGRLIACGQCKHVLGVLPAK